nr:hypothetical protein Itr_chr04CG02670 [Ipomoea trifida]
MAAHQKTAAFLRFLPILLIIMASIAGSAMTAEAARSLFQVADTPDTLPAPPPLVDELPPLPEVFPDVVPPPIAMDGIIPLGPVQSIAEEIVEPPIIA